MLWFGSGEVLRTEKLPPQRSGEEEQEKNRKTNDHFVDFVAYSHLTGLK